GAAWWERIGAPPGPLGARQAGLVDRAVGGPRLGVHLGREVALVADRDDVIEHAERGDDLGGGGEEGDDPHVRHASPRSSCGRPSVMVNQGAFDPTQTWSRGRTPGSSSRVPSRTRRNSGWSRRRL